MGKLPFVGSGAALLSHARHGLMVALDADAETDVFRGRASHLRILQRGGTVPWASSMSWTLGHASFKTRDYAAFQYWSRSWETSTQAMSFSWRQFNIFPGIMFSGLQVLAPR